MPAAQRRADADALPELDHNGKPKRVFQNMTIHKQYYEYHELKDLMYAQLRFVNNMGLAVMILGMAYVIYLTISLFVDSIVAPIPVIITEAMIYGSDMNELYKSDNESWTIIIYKVTGFTSAICFVIMASYIIYYKSVVKVDAMQHLQKMSVYCIYSYLAIGILHCVFVTIFVTSQTICPKTATKKDCKVERLDDDDQAKNTALEVISIIL